MATNESDTDTSSQKDGENSDNKCHYCVRKVKESVKCGKCDNNFHKSCMLRAANQENATCKHEMVEPNTAIKMLEMENTLLKRLLQEMTEKNQVLMENNSLLRGKITQMENQNIHKKSYAQITDNQNNPVNIINKTNPITKPIMRPQKENKTDNQNTDPSKVFQSTSVNKQLNLKTKNVNTQNQETINKQMEHELTNIDDVNGFKEVKYKVNKRHKVKTGTGINNNTTFKSSKLNEDKKAWLFISRIHKDVTETDIIKFIANKGKVQENKISVKILNLRNNENIHYNSIMLGVPFEMKDIAYENDFWPTGIKYTRFDFKRGQHFLDKRPPINNQL